MRNLARILPLKPKLPRKFQRFNAIDGKIEVTKQWKIVEFPKIWIKMKNCTTFYEVQTARHLKEIIQPLHPFPTPNQIQFYYVSGTKSILRRYTEIYTHLFSKYFKNAVLGRQEMVQCKYFFPQTEKCLLGNL